MPGGALEGEEHRLTATSGGSGRKSSSISIRFKPSVGVTSYFVGRKLDEHRGAFMLEHPMERGRVVDGGWDAMELLWEVSVLTFYVGRGPVVRDRIIVCFVYFPRFSSTLK